MIRKAQYKDIVDIVAIYDSIISEEIKGKLSTGWLPGIYPVQMTAESAYKRNDLYVLEDNNKIIASAIFNNIQVDTYKLCDWKYKTDENKVFVMHTLVVNPQYMNQGYGKQMLKFYEELAKDNNYSVLRLDTNLKNKVACEFYLKNGYIKAGIFPCDFNGIPDVNLVLFEKKVKI